MTKHVISAALIGAALALSACTTTTSQDYAVYREEIRSDPQSQRQATQQCVQTFSTGGAKWRAQLAQMARTSVAKGPSVACQRLVRAISNGTLTYGDVYGGRSGEKVFRVVRG